MSASRRNFIMAAGIGALMTPLFSQSFGAQSKTIRVGFAVPNPLIAGRRLAALSAGLALHGYIEKKNLIIEMRWPAGRERGLRDIPQEFIDANVDVIVIHGGTAMSQTLRALSDQKLSIPIVMATCDGAPPVAAGLPRRVTGLLNAPDAAPGQISLLRTLMPPLARLAVLSNPAFAGHPAIEHSVNIALQKSGIQMLPFHAQTPAEIETAFVDMVKAKSQALLVAIDPVVDGAGQQVARLALQHKLLSVFGAGEHTRVGGLASYGENLERTYQRAAVYIDKLLRGSKVSALPVEAITKLDLTLNQKTADALGLKIPGDVIARADKVWRT